MVSSFTFIQRGSHVLVTIISDASHCPHTLAGGYGCWIASNRGSKEFGGPLNDAMDSAEIEAKAACNALHFAITSGLVKRRDVILIQVDALAVLEMFSGRRKPRYREREILEWLTNIATRNDLIATGPYLRQLQGEVQISFSTPMDYCSRIMEQGAPVTSQRLKVARLLRNRDIGVIGRIEPVFPDRPDYFYSLGRRPTYSDQFVYWNNTLVRMLWATGIKEIFMSMVRMDRKTISEVLKAFGFDLGPYYRERLNGNPALSAAERKYYYSLIKSIAEPLHVFTTIVDPDKES